MPSMTEPSLSVWCRTVSYTHLYGKYLTKSSVGTIGGGYWKYTSNNGVTGTAYCVNHGLKGVSPSKALTVQEYNREPKTMGAFANGYPCLLYTSRCV